MELGEKEDPSLHKFLLLSPKPRQTEKPLTGATNLVKHFGLHTSSVISGPKGVHSSYRPYVSHLPGRIKTKDTETKLGSLFRAEEWPIPPDDDSLVLRPFGKEELAAFILQDGKIEEKHKRKRHKSKDGKKHRHRHRKGENGEVVPPAAGGEQVASASADGAKEEKRRHRHKKHRHSAEADGSQPKKKKRKKEHSSRDATKGMVGAVGNGVAPATVNLVQNV